MCMLDLDPCEVWQETRVRRAAKAHQCSACDGPIPPGRPYLRLFGKFEGETFMEKCCIPCSTINDKLAEAHEGMRVTYSALEDTLHLCIEEEPEMGKVWKPLLRQMAKRRRPAVQA